MIIPLSLACVLVISNGWATPLHSKTYLNDYAWKDFEGIVPNDAFIGGKDKAGRPIYIGQALYENKLIPGKIYENSPNILFEWKGKEYTQQNNVKILCTQVPNKFQWVPTESDNVVLLTDKILIKGGYEAVSYSVYLGRALVNGETLVGKVVCGAGECQGMYSSSNGAAINIKKFEVLIYVSNGADVEVKAQS